MSETAPLSSPPMTNQGPDSATSSTTTLPPGQHNADSSFSEEKYKRLKRKLREIMEINESMTKDYERAKKKIRRLTFERNLLLDNIARLENMGHSSEDNTSDVPSELTETESDMEEEAKPSAVTRPFPQRKQNTLTRTSSSLSSPATSPPRGNNNREMATVASAPPKRSKVVRVPTKVRRVQPIERDENGNPKLPQQIGVLTLLDLGKIVTDRDTFHTERYIFPVGYTVRRTYPSMINPNANTVITSTILDGGDGPRFHVVADDMPDQPIIANSATGAWTVVVRRSNEIRNREHSNSASGPDYYGFKHPTIAKLIQDLPGTEDLRHYIWQRFEEMEPRAAKGVMAAAEKKRGNLEQMGNANRRAPRVHEEEKETTTTTTTTTTTLYGEASNFDAPNEAERKLIANPAQNAHATSSEATNVLLTLPIPTTIGQQARSDEAAPADDEEVDQLGASDAE